MHVFGYTRLFADDAGVTHFDQVEQPYGGLLHSPPAAPLALAALAKNADVAVMRGDRSWAGAAFHPAPARQFLVVLAGTWQVTAGDGEQRAFGCGDVLLVEDTQGSGHSSRALTDDATALVIRLT